MSPVSTTFLGVLSLLSAEEEGTVARFHVDLDSEMADRGQPRARFKDGVMKKGAGAFPSKQYP